MPPTQDSSYADICREFVRRACFFHRISKSELASRIGIQPNSIATQVYRGQLSLEKAADLAELAQASDEECSLLELAWIEMRPNKNSSIYLRRSFQMLSELRKEVASFGEWLEERELMESYMDWRDERHSAQQ